MRKHTVTITRPDGEALVLRGEDVNTCSAMGWVRHRAWKQVNQFLGFGEEPCGAHMGNQSRTTEDAPMVFSRNHVLTWTPMVQDSQGVWCNDDARAVVAQVQVTANYSKEV